MLRGQARRGLAVLLFSLDLDELLEISDRVVVMFNGAVSPPIARIDVDRDIVGRLMTGLIPFSDLAKYSASRRTQPA
jgi:simple sugar transport system ATP-binding protein